MLADRARINQWPGLSLTIPDTDTSQPPINQCSHVIVRHWAGTITELTGYETSFHTVITRESCLGLQIFLPLSALFFPNWLYFVFIFKLTLLFISPCLFWHISILRDSSELSIEILTMIDTYNFPTTLPSFIINSIYKS